MLVFPEFVKARRVKVSRTSEGIAGETGHVVFELKESYLVTRPFLMSANHRFMTYMWSSIMDGYLYLELYGVRVGLWGVRHVNITSRSQCRFALDLKLSKEFPRRRVCIDYLS